MSAKSPFLKRGGGSSIPQNQPMTDVQKNIEAYLDKLKTMAEDGADESDMFNTILEDIANGNTVSIAASIAVLNSVIDSARAAAHIAIKKIESIEDDKLSIIDSGVKVVMSSLVNKGLLSEKDFQFSASQLSHLNKMIVSHEELNQDNIEEKRVDEILQELSDKAYKMAAIELGDLYGKAKE